MDDCRNPNPSAEEREHGIEHGEHHMDGELCGMGEGSEKDKPLTASEIKEALEVDANARA